MQVEIFAVCDFACTYGQKLVMSGPFDTIYTAKVPAVHNFCAIATRIRFQKSEEGKHPFKLNILDLDGIKLVPELTGVMDVKISEGQTSGAPNFVINLPNLSFEKFGTYAISLTVDGQEARSIPIHVSQIPRPKEAEPDKG